MQTALCIKGWNPPKLQWPHGDNIDINTQPHPFPPHPHPPVGDIHWPWPPRSQRTSFWVILLEPRRSWRREEPGS